MTDSYHYQIEPEPRAEVPKFRIGGVYRDGGDSVYLLREAGGEKLAVASQWESDACEFDRRGELHRLDNGRFDAIAEVSSKWHLVPVELTLRDGQWVPADAPIVFPSGAAVLTSGDKIVGRVEAQTLANGLTAEETDATASVMGIVGKRTEPNRAPLPHFNQRTPHDTFGPDFIVTKGEVPTAPLHTSPTTDSAYPAIAGLLRG